MSPGLARQGPFAPPMTWFLIAACCACRDPRPAGPALELTGDPTAGEAQYQIVCAGCHGPDGGGILRAPALRATSAGLSDAIVVDVMLNGRGGMPAKPITDQQAADILAFMRARWGAAPP